MGVATASRKIEHPAIEDVTLESVLHALSDPVRLQVVTTLADNSTAMACSAIPLTVSKSTSTHHFKVLREAGIVRQTYVGTARMSELRRADLARRFPGLLDTVLALAGETSQDAGVPAPTAR